MHLLLEDYAFFARDPELFCERLGALTQLRGREQVQAWQALVRAGNLETVVRELLVKHTTTPAMRPRSAATSPNATCATVTPRDRSPAAMAELARVLAAEA